MGHVAANQKKKAFGGVTYSDLYPGGGGQVRKRQKALRGRKRRSWAAPSFGAGMRLKRLNKLLDKYKGRLDADTAHLILQDRFSPIIGANRAMGEIVAAPATVQSLILDPAGGAFYIAPGPAPVCHGYFCGFNIQRVFLSAPGDGELPRLPASGFYRTPGWKSLRQIYKAYESCWWERDSAEALRLTHLARSTFVGEPHYHLLEGLLALKAGKLDNAKELLRKALTFPLARNRRAMAHLWLGRAHDLSGDRADAVMEYEFISRFPDMDIMLADAVRKNRAEPYAAKNLRRIAIDFFDPYILGR